MSKAAKVLKSEKRTSKNKESETEKIISLLSAEIKSFFKQTLGFKEFTPVQQCSIKYFMDNYDCIVQAPTGSGKTLAYLLPMLQILLNTCKGGKSDNKAKICGLILVPTKELVQQVAAVIQPLTETLQFHVAALTRSKKNEYSKIKNDCIVISTPARFANMIDANAEIKTMLKSLEMLVIDEADRFNDVDFKDTTTKILAVLPKQRRTGLFSATQAKEAEDLVKFGLRNPVRLEVGSGAKTVVNKEFEKGEEKEVIETKKVKKAKTTNTVTPESLINTFVVVDPSHKLLCFHKYLLQMKDKKVLVFFSSRFAVLYFAQVLNTLFSGSRQVLCLHGKKAGRQHLLSKFNMSKGLILLSTDIAGRGLDLTNVDAVVQFDLPKLSSWFVHRIGRAGRNGKAGQSLAIFTKQEEAYPAFVQKHENIDLKENSIAKSLTDEGAEKIRKKIIKKASEEREFLELGSLAFVGMLNAYIGHDSQIVAKLSDQDIGALANSYGLLRIPQCNETRKCDISSFKDPGVDTRTIPYKDLNLELARQQKLKSPRKSLSAEQKKQMFESRRKKKKVEKNETADAAEIKAVTPQKRKKKMTEWEELQTGNRLLKKFKKGKINKEELDEGMDKI